MKDEEYSLFTGMGLEKESKWHGVGAGGKKKSSKLILNEGKEII